MVSVNVKKVNDMIKLEAQLAAVAQPLQNPRAHVG